MEDPGQDENTGAHAAASGDPHDAAAALAGRTRIVERLVASDASIVFDELQAAGIASQLLARPHETETGPFDILVLDGDVDAALDVLDTLELIDEPDNWFSERPVWQQAAFVVLGIMLVLIPVFFALVAIISG